MQVEFKKKPIRSYVIRGGRMTEAQGKAFERWWPQFGLSLFDGQFNRAEFCADKRLVLEIGFGMGDSLFEMLQEDPLTNYIGIEVHPPGVGRLINNAGKAKLRNLKVYMADAVDVLSDCIPDNALDRVQLFFPDPWHKKKHNKRRLVQPEFIREIRQKLKPGAVFHVATDWEDYAEFIMAVMTSSEGFENCAGEYLYSTSMCRPKTRFEQRGERLGHGVWDICFKKVA